jgi:hypothetical protein
MSLTQQAPQAFIEMIIRIKPALHLTFIGTFYAE